MNNVLINSENIKGLKFSSSNDFYEDDFNAADTHRKAAKYHEFSARQHEDSARRHLEAAKSFDKKNKHKSGEYTEIAHGHQNLEKMG